jgi:flagellin-specific chaperone FliS
MIKMKVPKWKTPYPFLNDANKEQKRFYKAFVSMLDKDEKIELKGNLSYIFVYLYKTLTKFIIKKDIND